MANTPTLTKGDLWELRVARLLFAEGWFVRRSVNLTGHFGANFTATDIDIFGISFDPSLRAHRTIGECKTSESKSGPQPADRAIWGRGLRELVGADSNFIATVRSLGDPVRRLAAQLGTELMDEGDVAHRERILGIDPTKPLGPHTEPVVQAERIVRAASKDDEELRRIYWFVRSDFWFLAPVVGLKRVLGACRLIEKRWHSNLPPDEAEKIRWLCRQLFVLAAIAFTSVAAESYRQPPHVSRPRLLEQLSEGIANFSTLREISRQVDRYVTTVLAEAGVDRSRTVHSLGAFEPRPPQYAETLLETIERLAGEPGTSAQLGRLAEWRVTEAQIGTELAGMPADLVPYLDDGDRLLRTLATFLTGQAIRLPSELLVDVVGRGASTRDEDRIRHAAHRTEDPVDTHEKSNASSEAQQLALDETAEIEPNT
jgi:hypothetical protein